MSVKRAKVLKKFLGLNLKDVTKKHMIIAIKILIKKNLQISKNNKEINSLTGRETENIIEDNDNL